MSDCCKCRLQGGTDCDIQNGQSVLCSEHAVVAGLSARSEGTETERSASTWRSQVELNQRIRLVIAFSVKGQAELDTQKPWNLR